MQPLPATPAPADDRTDAVRRRRLHPRALATALLLAALLVLESAVMSRALGPLEHTLFPDDAFYYLCIGRNLADGLGPSFDGVHATTGFQPLWQAAVAIVAMGPFGEASFVTAVAALNLGLIGAGAVLLVLALGRRGVPPWLSIAAILIAFANPYLLKTSLNGMESGLVWATWSVAIVVLIRLLERRAGLAAATAAGAVAGLVVLTRLDGAGLALALGLVCVVSARGSRMKALLIWGATAAGVVGPYFAWMVPRFGHWLPVSVLVKSAPGNALLRDLVVAVLALVLGAVIWSLARARLPATARAAGIAVASGAAPLLAYALISPRRLSHLWYYPGTLLSGLMLTAILGAEIFARGRRGLVTTIGVLGIGLAAAGWWLRAAVHRSEDHYRTADAIGRYLRVAIPAETRVAGWDVGLVGYRRRCRVTNLDGLVNSYDFLAESRARRLVSYLDREGIAGIVQFFEGDPRGWLTNLDPALPGRLTEQVRFEYDFVSPMALPLTSRRRAFIYFDYRPPSTPAPVAGPARPYPD